jgi:hypothetical protein
MAQYNSKAIIPLADVCRGYFSHLTPEKLMRKVMAGQISLPIVSSAARRARRVSIYRTWRITSKALSNTLKA